MKTIIIKDGVVVNIGVGEPENSAPEGYVFDVVEDDFQVGIGWTKTEAGYEAPAAPELPIETIKVVTMRQARLALLQAGLLANVEAAINSLPSPQKEAAQIEWEYSQEVRRDREFVTQLTAAMGLTELQVDDLFILAATL